MHIAGAEELPRNTRRLGNVPLLKDSLTLFYFKALVAMRILYLFAKPRDSYLGANDGGHADQAIE